MIISLDDLRAFILVADKQGFGKAAESLNLTQSALTRRLQKVEEYLGARLFDRSTRQVDLTAIGREFLPSARRILHEYERSLAGIEDVIAKRSGMVTMTSLMTVAFGVLPSVLADFNAEYPDIRVRILDDTGSRIAGHIRSGAAEFGIDMAHATDPDIDFEPVLTEPYIVACHPSHPLAGSGPLRWEDLNRHRCVSLGPASGIGRQLNVPQTGQNWIFEVQHLSTMMGLIASGSVVGIVPSLVLHANPGTDLVSLALIDPPANRDIGLVTRRGGALSPAAETLMSTIREELRRVAARQAQDGKLLVEGRTKN